ncbi:MAG: hypothetical protein Q8O75_03290 [bacterium]|nr:hypothetical protein [bacterium]
MNLAIFLFLSFALLGSIEVAKRQFKLSADITRKATHVGAALIAAASPLFLSPIVIVVSCLFFAGLLFAGRSSNLFSSIHDVKRKTYGAVFLPLGEALSAIVFLSHGVREFQFGVLVMGISDPLASLIGERFGRHNFKILGNRKSVEGSLSFFLSALVITFIFSPVFGLPLILIPLVLTFVELVLGYGFDNLALPATGALLLTLL